MINANELRIGNWVNFVYEHKREKMSRVCIVISMSEREIVVVDKGVSLVADFDPIPLTPEILEACGFAKGIDNKWRIWDNDSFYIYGAAAPNSGLYAPYVMPELKHLHQLQNLYFALTGTELIFSPLNV